MRETSPRRLEFLDECVGVRGDQDVSHSSLGDARPAATQLDVAASKKGRRALERDPPVICLGRGRGSEQRAGIRTVGVVRVVTVHLRRRALDVGERRLAEPDPGRQQTRFLLGEPSPGRFVVAEREPDRGGGHALAALVAAEEPRGYPVQAILRTRGRASGDEGQRTHVGTLFLNAGFGGGEGMKGRPHLVPGTRQPRGVQLMQHLESLLCVRDVGLNVWSDAATRDGETEGERRRAG